MNQMKREMKEENGLQQWYMTLQTDRQTDKLMEDGKERLYM